MQRCDKVLITNYKMHGRRHQERTIRMGWADLKEHRTEILECWIDPERDRGWPLDISEEVGHAREDTSRGRGANLLQGGSKDGEATAWEHLVSLQRRVRLETVLVHVIVNVRISDQSENGRYFNFFLDESWFSNVQRKRNCLLVWRSCCFTLFYIWGGIRLQLG